MSAVGSVTTSPEGLSVSSTSRPKLSAPAPEASDVRNNIAPFVRQAKHQYKKVSSVVSLTVAWELLRQELGLNVLSKLVMSLIRGGTQAQESGEPKDVIEPVKGGLFDASIDLIELLMGFPLQILLTALIGRWFVAPASGLKDFRLLAKPTHEIAKARGKSITVGEMNPREIHLDETTYRRAIGGKFATTVVSALTGISFLDAAPAIRTLIADALGANDFLALYGFEGGSPDQALHQDNVATAREHAIRNLLWLGGLLAASPVIGAALGRGLRKGGVSTQVAKIFDMDQQRGGFGLSRLASTTPMLLLGPWAYASVAFGPAQAQEEWNRLWLVSVPSVLGLTPGLQMVNSMLASAGHQVQNKLKGEAGNYVHPWKPLQTYWQEMKNGERDIFEFDLSKPEEQLAKEMRQAGHSQASIDRRLKLGKFMGGWGVFAGASILGLVVNLLNFERDKEIYASQAEAVSKNMASDSLPPGGGQGLTSAALTK